MECTHRLAYPPSRRPKIRVLHMISKTKTKEEEDEDEEEGEEARSFCLLSSVMKAPRDIFCCSFFFGAIKHVSLAPYSC